MTDLHPENVPPSVNQSEDLRHDSRATRRRGGTAPAGRPKAAAGEAAPAPRRAPPVLRLVALYPRTEGHLLAVGPNTVGRHPGNDVILVSPDGACLIQDLGSTDGVHVGAERNEDPLLLRDGDVIRV